MALQESDISWQTLRGILHHWAGNAAELAEVKPLHGGCIHTTLLLATTDNCKSVLKVSPHRVDRTYEDEAHQLSALRRAGLPVPEVYKVHTGDLDFPHSYILLEYVDGMDLSAARRVAGGEEFGRLQEELGEYVARLHQTRGEQYKRVTVSELGRGYDDWPVFFREVYDRIWQETEKDGKLPVKVRKKIGRIHSRLDLVLRHDDCPRLVHWDLWGTNLLVCPNGSGRWRVAAFLDPNSKFAHAEAEIAYLELFHTVTPAFMKAYQHHCGKLSPDYHRLRKHVYQMYPLIDHVNLFGQEYVKPLCERVERLSQMV
jgi:fructosamine-3-kinase